MRQVRLFSVLGLPTSSPLSMGPSSLGPSLRLWGQLGLFPYASSAHWGGFQEQHAAVPGLGGRTAGIGAPCLEWPALERPAQGLR